MARTKEYVGIARGTLDCLKQHLESHGLASLLATAASSSNKE
jgi:hypothetical protein